MLRHTTPSPGEPEAETGERMTVDTTPAENSEDFAPVEPAKAARTWKSVALAWARRILLVVVIAGACWTITRNWPTVWATLKTMPWEAVVLSELAVIVGIGFGVLSWRTLVEDLGPHVGVWRCAQINLVGSLGKYLPGSVWAVLLQMGLARKRSGERRVGEECRSRGA